MWVQGPGGRGQRGARTDLDILELVIVRVVMLVLRVRIRRGVVPRGVVLGEGGRALRTAGSARRHAVPPRELHAIPRTRPARPARDTPS